MRWNRRTTWDGRERQRGREGVGGRERERERERGREGGRESGREGERERGREGSVKSHREGEIEQTLMRETLRCLEKRELDRGRERNLRMRNRKQRGGGVGGPCANNGGR